MFMRFLRDHSNPFLPEKQISFRRTLAIHFLSGFFVAGLFFVLIFGILCLIFPLPDNIKYATCILDDRGQVVHAFLPEDQQWRMRLDSNELTPLLKSTIIF